MMRNVFAGAWIVLAAAGLCGMPASAVHDASSPAWSRERLYMDLSARQRAFIAAPRLAREQAIADAEARVELTAGSKCAVDGVINFRDLGGLRGEGGKPLRKGVLFRSGRFDQISPRGREMLVKRLGIKTDLDLRSDGETAGLRGVSPLGTNVQWRLVSLRAYDAIGTEAWRKQMKKALEVVFDSRNWPVAFHCKTGKDRTGTLAFIVLALLGVAEDDICLDWEVTAFYVPELSRMDHPGRYDRLLSYVNGLPGKDLREKARHYVLSLGFSSEAIELFRQGMLQEENPRPGVRTSEG